MKSKFLNVKRVGALALAAAMAVPMAQPVNCFAAEQENTVLGGKQTYIVGTIDANELELDVTVPLGGIQFNIDSEGVMTSQGMVIKSNTIAPLTVTILDVTGQAEQTDIDGTITNFPAPILVDKDTYVDWDNLDYHTSMSEISIALHKVDVADGEDGAKIAGTSYSGSDANEAVALDAIKDLASGAGVKITELASAFNNADGTFAAIDICNDNVNTKYGKTWLGNGQYKVGYALDLEFGYPGFEHYTGN